MTIPPESDLDPIVKLRMKVEDDNMSPNLLGGITTWASASDHGLLDLFQHMKRKLAQHDAARLNIASLKSEVQD